MRQCIYIFLTGGDFVVRSKYIFGATTDVVEVSEWMVWCSLGSCKSLCFLLPLDRIKVEVK